MSRTKNVRHGFALLVADGHGHFGVEAVAVGPHGRHFHPLAQQRAFADVQVAVDAILLAGAGGRRKQHLRGLGAQHFFPRMPERLLRRLVELRDDPPMVDRNDRVERRFEDGAFSGLGLGQGGFQAIGAVRPAVAKYQAGGMSAVVRFDAQQPGMHVGEFAGLHVAEPAVALPMAGFIDGGHGHVAQLRPRFFSVQLAQRDGGRRLGLAQSHQPLPGGIQIKRLAVRRGQQNEIGVRFRQNPAQRLGVCNQQLRPIAHNPTPPMPPQHDHYLIITLLAGMSIQSFQTANKVCGKNRLKIGNIYVDFHVKTCKMHSCCGIDLHWRQVYVCIGCGGDAHRHNGVHLDNYHRSFWRQQCRCSLKQNIGSPCAGGG